MKDDLLGLADGPKYEGPELVDAGDRALVTERAERSCLLKSRPTGDRGSSEEMVNVRNGPEWAGMAVVSQITFARSPFTDPLEGFLSVVGRQN